MKNRIKLIILAVAAAVGLSNCIDVHQVINVKKDGSGTIEETMFISLPPELAALGGDQDPLGELLKGDSQKKRAKEMGEGVELVSSEAIEKDGKKGLKTVFKFSDISKVKLNGDAGMSAMAEGMPGAQPPEKKGDDEIIKVGFEKGDTSKLTITTPPMKGVDTPDQEVDPTQFAMASQMMKGMRVRVTIKPDGKITKTNASYSDSESVTLADMQMDKLFEDYEKFKAFAALGKEKDREKIGAKMKELGIKGETKEKVTVEFK